MVDPWELLLHHSYTGAPGVIFDQSPSRRNHGRSINLDASDFSLDGAGSGTGSVRLRQNSAVRVVPSESWDKLTAVRCEFVGKYRNAGGTLIDAENFRFSVHHGVPSYSYNAAYGGSGEGVGPVGSPGTAPAIPADSWVTVGLIYGAIQGSGFFYTGSCSRTSSHSDMP